MNANIGFDPVHDCNEHQAQVAKLSSLIIWLRISIGIITVSMAGLFIGQVTITTTRAADKEIQKSTLKIVENLQDNQREMQKTQQDIIRQVEKLSTVVDMQNERQGERIDRVEGQALRNKKQMMEYEARERETLRKEKN